MDRVYEDKTGVEVTEVTPFNQLTLAPIVMQSRRRYSDFYQLKTPSLLPLSFNSEKDQRGDHQTL